MVIGSKSILGAVFFLLGGISSTGLGPLGVVTLDEPDLGGSTSGTAKVTELVGIWIGRL